MCVLCLNYGMGCRLPVVHNIWDQQCSMRVACSSWRVSFDPSNVLPRVWKKVKGEALWQEVKGEAVSVNEVSVGICCQ